MPTQQDSTDPWILLNQLASNGLESVAIEVRFNGNMVALTDRALELALLGQSTDEVPEEELAAANVFCAMSAEGEASIAERARQGDEFAQRAYQALVLRQLVKYRIGARKLANGAMSGDQSSKAKIAAIKAQATTPGPQQKRARVAAWLLRDALQESKRRASPVKSDEVEEETPISPQTPEEIEAQLQRDVATAQAS